MTPDKITPPEGTQTIWEWTCLNCGKTIYGEPPGPDLPTWNGPVPDPAFHPSSTYAPEEESLTTADTGRS